MRYLSPAPNGRFTFSRSGHGPFLPYSGPTSIGDGAIPEQVATDLGVSRSTLYRELRKHREGGVAERVVGEG